MKTIHSLLAAALLAGCAGRCDVLTDERFERVQVGMTRDQAMRLVGAPSETMRFPGTRTESWDYDYQDAWGYLASYSLTFGPDGRIVAKLSRRLNDGGDHGSN